MKPGPVSPYAASKLCGEHYTLLFSKTSLPPRST